MHTALCSGHKKSECIIPSPLTPLFKTKLNETSASTKKNTEGKVWVREAPVPAAGVPGVRPQNILANIHFYDLISDSHR